MNGDSAKATAKETAQSAETAPVVRWLARGGVAMVGLLHIIIGALAVSVATGSGGGEADQSGALNQLAKTPGGTVVLWSIIIGMLALALWQVLEVLLTRRKDDTRKWGHRIVELGKGAAYVFIAATAFTFARGSHTSTQDATQQASGALLGAPGGIIVLVIIGLMVVITGGSFVFRGVTGRFVQDIRMPREPWGLIVTWLGVIGYAAKGVLLGVVGALFLVAAFTVDPEKAAGLDGAIKTIEALPYGGALLIAAGVGLVAYGLYFLARARLVKL
ncbi:DUF1206 domain-containing protein [Glaciibacter sp. 2TAF33]|uniref:DUF1206 domain-containing protein n=1 Tax=Glaciibacter sp. 2TAF33 TaxID=3233015 RepID=UPI003F93ADA1